MEPSLSAGDLQTGELMLGKRPALILVDLSNGFSSPLSPLGGDFSEQLRVAKKVMDCFVTHQMPMFFTSVVYESKEQASVFRQRLPDLNILQKGSDWVAINSMFLPLPEHAVILEKQHPSAFFNTHLAEQLISMNADSVVVLGLTTSGCVRATCVDTLQHNFPCFVVSDACGDRNQEAHLMSLHDMHAKYARVLDADTLIHSMNSLSA